MIKHYLKVGLRSLLKYKGQSILSVICLAIGIVVFSLVFFFIQYLNYSTDFTDYEQRIQFTLSSEQTGAGSFFYQYDIQRLEEHHLLGIDSLAIHSFSDQAEMNVIGKDQQEKPFIIHYKCANPFFFSYYQLPLMYGDRLPVKSDEIVISQEFAKKICGKDTPVGMAVHMVEDQGITDNQIKDFVIVNVISDNKKELDLDADCYFALESHSGTPLSVSGRLTKDASLSSVKKQLEKITWERGEETMRADAFSVAQRQKERGGAQVLMLFISSLILISGLINFLKFIIQMFFNRQRELALRKCIGSNTKGLFSLLFAEVLWMMTFALLFSFVVTEVLISVAKVYIPQDEFPEFSLLKVCVLQLIVYISLLLISLLVIGVPIYRLRHISLIHFVMRSNKRHLVRNIMIGLQLGISMFFVGGVLVINLSYSVLFGKMYNPISSEEESHIISLSVNSQRMKQNMEAILSDISALPDITDRTSSTLPINVNSYTYMTYGNTDRFKATVAVSTGDPHYFSFFQIPMDGKVVGTGAEGNVYISEDFQTQLKKDSVQGVVTLDDKNYNIAGVYKALYKEYKKKPHMAGSVFLPSANASAYYFKISSTGNVDECIQKITDICRRYVPLSLPVNIQSLDNTKQTLDGTLDMMRNGLVLLAFISILLVVLSVYSAISMDTINRQKEVAIRKINGATPRIIAMLFGKTYIIVFLSTFTIVYPLLRTIMIHAMGKSGIVCVYDWSWGITLFIVIALLLLFVTGYKIYRIIRVNPATIIKNE